ncbi:hypothetical protein D3C71_1542840 [compost metagenome]
MHQVFVKHAQHDVDRGDGGDDQHQHRGRVHCLAETTTLGLADIAGHAQAVDRRLHDGIAFAAAHARCQVVAQVHHRVLVLVRHLRRCQPRFLMRDGGERNHLPATGTHVQIFDGGRAGGLPGQRVDHHAVLIEVGVDGGDLSLAEGAVQRAVDGTDAHAQTRGLVAVDDDLLHQAALVHVRAHVTQLGILLEHFHQLGQPLGQLPGIVALQGHAVLRAL